MLKDCRYFAWSRPVIVGCAVVGLCGALVGCDATSNGKVKSGSERGSEASAQSPEEETPEEEAAQAKKSDEKAQKEGGDVEGAASLNEVRSKKKRLEKPEISVDARQKVVAGNTQFAFDLYKNINKTSGATTSNIFFSPFSISEVLAMAYAGAGGDTADEMAKALHFDGEATELHPAFNAVDTHLMALNKEASDLEEAGNSGKEEGPQRPAPLQLSVANSIWGQQDYKFNSDFLDTLAVYYGAGLQTLDFVGASEESRETINQWVEKKTKERIKDLIPEGALSADTRMVLTNAIYFKAGWTHQFQKDQTEAGEFKSLDGSKIKTDLMRQQDYFEYAALKGFKAIELPYGDGEASMLVLLPEDMKKFQDSFAPKTLEDVDKALKRQYVELILPKFEFSQSLTLGKTLAELGMGGAFSPEADFSNMSDADDLFIDDVVHQAFVAVDEEGTEAAAATALMMRTTSMPPEPVKFRADKPFIFLIRDAETKSVLFMGQVNKPEKED